MMRSLWTAASGMKTQQTNVDIIANNLANVNTAAFKKETAEFKSLLYQTIQAKTTSANGDEKPIGAQVGLGVRVSAITSHFKQGIFQATEEPFDFSLEGDGFFQLKGEDGNTYYTRNGSFRPALASTGMMLADSDGRAVLDTSGRAIVFDASLDVSKITVSQNGELFYPDSTGNAVSMGITLGIVQFSNPAGLEKEGDSLYKATDASGEPIPEGQMSQQYKTGLRQGYLEGSNVQVADEMVNLIVAQRAYQMNSKAIQSADTMLEQANNLKR
jgi:flagellar basal-body rod protein FlgG